MKRFLIVAAATTLASVGGANAAKLDCKELGGNARFFVAQEDPLPNPGFVADIVDGYGRKVGNWHHLRGDEQFWREMGDWPPAWEWTPEDLRDYQAAMAHCAATAHEWGPSYAKSRNELKAEAIRTFSTWLGDLHAKARQFRADRVPFREKVDSLDRHPATMDGIANMADEMVAMKEEWPDRVGVMHAYGALADKADVFDEKAVGAAEKLRAEMKAAEPTVAGYREWRQKFLRWREEIGPKWKSVPMRRDERRRMRAPREFVMGLDARDHFVNAIAEAKVAETEGMEPQERAERVAEMARAPWTELRKVDSYAQRRVQERLGWLYKDIAGEANCERQLTRNAGEFGDGWGLIGLEDIAFWDRERNAEGAEDLEAAVCGLGKSGFSVDLDKDARSITVTPRYRLDWRRAGMFFRSPQEIRMTFRPMKDYPRWLVSEAIWTDGKQRSGPENPNAHKGVLDTLAKVQIALP